MKGILFKADRAGIRGVAEVILRGGVAAFPTETFYGLGADARNEEALGKIFQIKGREDNKPLLVLIADREWLPGLAGRIPPVAGRLMERFWPGPLTLVFEARPGLSALLTAGTGTVGVRLSPHPVAQGLVAAVGRPVTATSANLSGQPSASVASEVSRALGDRVDAILDGGPTAGGLGSTVVDVSGPSLKILRQGALSRAELAPFFESS
jgi:L-threonylcarbamoyladenylate synthase